MSTPQQHLLTQSYYDELLSDNAELYDLENVENCPQQQDQCVRETLEELGSGLTGSGTTASTPGNAATAVVISMMETLQGGRWTI